MNAISLWEGQILLWIQNNLRTPFFNTVAKILAVIGDKGIGWIALALLLILIPRTRRTGHICALSILITFIIVNVILKPWVNRIRPYDLIEQLEAVTPKLSDASFPSGHASNGFACAWVIFRLRKRDAWIWVLVLAILISLSRLYVGVHYPTDVLAGAAIAIICAEFSIRAGAAIERKIRRKKDPAKT